MISIWSQDWWYTVQRSYLIATILAQKEDIFAWHVRIFQKRCDKKFKHEALGKIKQRLDSSYFLVQNHWQSLKCFHSKQIEVLQRTFLGTNTGCVQIYTRIMHCCNSITAVYSFSLILILLLSDKSLLTAGPIHILP